MFEVTPYTDLYNMLHGGTTLNSGGTPIIVSMIHVTTPVQSVPDKHLEHPKDWANKKYYPNATCSISQGGWFPQNQSFLCGTVYTGKAKRYFLLW